MECFTSPLSIDPDKTLPLHSDPDNWITCIASLTTSSFYFLLLPRVLSYWSFSTALILKVLLLDGWGLTEAKSKQVQYCSFDLQELETYNSFYLLWSINTPMAKKPSIFGRKPSTFSGQQYVRKIWQKPSSTLDLPSVFRKCFNCSYLSFCQILSRPDVVWIWIWGRKEAR